MSTQLAKLRKAYLTAKPSDQLGTSGSRYFTPDPFKLFPPSVTDGCWPVDSDGNIVKPEAGSMTCPAAWHSVSQNMTKFHDVMSGYSPSSGTDLAYYLYESLGAEGGTAAVVSLDSAWGSGQVRIGKQSFLVRQARRQRCAPR